MQPLKTVQKLELEAGDILHIKLGGVIDGSDWLPTREDLWETREEWQNVIPEDVGLIVTHHLINSTIIRTKIRNTIWPPKIIIDD